MIESVLFDLDGTLTDPGEGIMLSMQYALSHFGIQEPVEAMRRYVGPPLEKEIMAAHGFTHEKACDVVDKYRERYIATGVYENKLYPGIKNTLTQLKSAGKNLYIATSKGERSAGIVLEHFGLSPYFSFVAGSLRGGVRSDKAEVIAHLVEQTKLNPKTAVMVGDREHDIIGAKKHGIPAVGVLYGYGSQEELKAADAVALAKDAEDLERILLAM